MSREQARQLAVLRTAIRKLRRFATDCRNAAYAPPLDRLHEDADKVLRETASKELKRRMMQSHETKRR